MRILKFSSFLFIFVEKDKLDLILYYSEKYTTSFKD